MNPKHAVQAVGAWRKARLPVVADPPARRSSGAAHETDNALRFAIRSEVAGATPRSDAWQRLQQRLAHEALPPSVVLGYGRPVVSVSPFSPYSAFTRNLLSRFSQLGVALLLVLTVVGDPATLDRLTRPGGRLAHVNPVTQQATPLPPAPRVNRAALIDAADAAAEDMPPQTVEESDPQPASVYIPSPPITQLGRVRQAVDPDTVPTPLQAPKADPR
ncbi:MAG: hypothetical protein M3Z04_19750 [Chloroflexota bacterium]|nr:hypothetical protein [Chloroflexota bacterium]